MEQTKFDCDCDLVIEMDEMGIGIDEILQYARGTLSRDEIRTLIRGLEEVVASPVADES